MTAGLNPSFSKIRRPELPRSVPVDKGGHVKGSDVIEGELSNLARDALTDPPACRVRLTLHTGYGSCPGTSATTALDRPLRDTPPASITAPSTAI